MGREGSFFSFQRKKVSGMPNENLIIRTHSKVLETETTDRGRVNRRLN